MHIIGQIIENDQEKTKQLAEIYHQKAFLARKCLIWQRSEKNRVHLAGDETFFHIDDESMACVIKAVLVVTLG